MAKFFRSQFVQKWLLLGLVWALGLCAVGWATPVGPREPAAMKYSGEFLGFLRDGQTVLGRSYEGPRNGQTLSTYDYMTGKRLSLVPLEATSLSYADRAEFIEGKDLVLCIKKQRDKEKDADKDTTQLRLFTLSIFKIPSGQLVSKIVCRSPFTLLRKELSKNANRVAVLCQNEDDSVAIHIYSLPDFQLIRSFPLSELKTKELALFDLSPNGKVLSLTKRLQPLNTSQSYDLFDVNTGQKLCALPASLYGSAVYLSPDGNTAIDENGVWDVRTGIKRFSRPEKLIIFAPDNRYLIFLDHDKTSWRLEYCDVNTGEEVLERRMTLPISFKGGVVSRTDLNDDSTIVIEKVKLPRNVPSYLECVARLPGFDWIATSYPEHVMIDYPSGKIIDYGPGSVRAIAPDRRSFLAANQNDLYLWDIPSTRPWISLLLSWTVWSLIFWLTQNRIFMILRMTAPSPQPSPPRGEGENHALQGRLP
jgi:hypothetical protein